MQQVSLMTTRQAAAVLKRDVRTIHRWISEGKLTATKVPGYKGAYLIEPDDLTKLAEASNE